MSEPVDPALALWALADAEETSRQQSESYDCDGAADTPPNPATLESNIEPTSDLTLVPPSDSANDNAVALTESETPAQYDPSVAIFTPIPFTGYGASHTTAAAQESQNTGEDEDDGDSFLEDENRELRALERFYGSNAVFHTADLPAMPPFSSTDGKPEKKSMMERAAHLPRSQMHTAVDCCARSGRLHRFFYNLLVGLWILFIYVIPGTTLFILVTVLGLVPNLALIAADGAVALVIGNVILRATHLAHYAEPGKAAAIGAVGAVLSTLCVGAAFYWLPRDEESRPPKIVAFPLVVLMMTLAGVIGTSLLQKHGVDLGDTDVLHGARAGALGGVIIAPLMITIGPMVIVALGLLLTPLWIAMAAGLKWVWGRSNATWNGRWSRSSYCYVYGRCGADPEIDAEIEEFEAFSARYDVIHRQPAWNSMTMNTFGGGMA